MTDSTKALLASWGLHLHDLSPRTRELYRDCVRRFAEFVAIDLLDVTKRDAERYFADQHDRGLAQATVRSRWIALRSFYRWAHEEGEIDVNPLAAITVARADPPPPDVPDDDTVARVLKGCAGRGFMERRDLAMIRLCAATGLRLGELCSLKIADVDLAARTILVRKGKGGKIRIVRFDAETGAAVDRYLRARGRYVQERPRLAHHDDLWLTRFGPFTRKGAMEMLPRRCERVGVPVIHWHALRHRFAHVWLRAGGTEGDLARLGGWSDPTVMRRYGAALATDRALAAYDTLGGVL